MPNLPDILLQPARFAEALADRSVRELLPNALSSHDLAKLQPLIRRHAAFSARVPYARHLSVLDRIIQMMLDPDHGPDGVSPRRPGQYMNEPRARKLLRQSLWNLGYEPEPGREGGIKDLGSEQRVRLQLDTSVGLARGYGQAALANDPDILDEFPGWRLLPSTAAVPRGDAWWRSRWQSAGLPGPFGSDFVALKSDPGWARLSRFGTPFPPFDYGSTRRVEEVDRETCERHGLIKPGEKARPADIQRPAALRAELPRGAEALREKILAQFPNARYENGVLTELS